MLENPTIMTNSHYSPFCCSIPPMFPCTLCCLNPMFPYISAPMFLQFKSQITDGSPYFCWFFPIP